MQPFNEKDCEEEAFQRFFFEHNIQLLRLALLIAAPLYMLFGFWDHLLAPELIGKTLAIRGFVMVFLITLLIFSYTTNFISYYKPLVATATLLAAMGVTAILVILPEGEVLGVSGVLLVIFFLTIFNILFFWTLLAGSSIVIGFTAYTSFFSDIEWEVIASSNFFLVSGAFLAASAAYQTERLTRFTFQLTRKRDIERQERVDWLENMAGFLRHELKNAMIGIDSSVDLIDRKTDRGKDTISSYINRAKKSVMYMKSLLSEVDEATTLEAAIKNAYSETIELSALVEDKCVLYREAFPDLSIKCSVESGIDIFGSTVRIEQVLDKLISNAIEHCADEHDIVVNLSSTDDDAILSISDRGDTLPSETDALFERGYSTKKNASADNKGLGLYIAKRATESMQGEIKVIRLENPPGAEFLLRLPKVNAQ